MDVVILQEYDEPCHPLTLERRTEELNATIEPPSFENDFNLHEKLQRLRQFQDEGHRRCTTEHVSTHVSSPIQNDAEGCRRMQNVRVVFGGPVSSVAI